jgi:pimeloyl-ACP methyl ester carboxylesterase
MKNVYIISGLGADARIFHKIDLSFAKAHFLEWIAPLKNESLAEYALRFSKLIIHQNPIIIGLSFGGIVAVEIDKIIQTEKIILISSAKVKNEIPLLFRIAGICRLNNLIPYRFLKKSNLITEWFFGVNEKEDKILLKTVLNETDAKFLKWAISKILLWRNKTLPANFFHIHGAADKILPQSNIGNAMILKNGGHLMILDHHQFISKILKKEII